MIDVQNRVFWLEELADRVERVCEIVACFCDARIGDCDVYLSHTLENGGQIRPGCYVATIVLNPVRKLLFGRVDIQAVDFGTLGCQKLCRCEADAGGAAWFLSDVLVEEMGMRSK